MKGRNWKRRLLSLTMSLALALTLLPVGAAAVEPNSKALTIADGAAKLDLSQCCNNENIIISKDGITFDGEEGAAQKFSTLVMMGNSTQFNASIQIDGVPDGAALTLDNLTWEAKSSFQINADVVLNIADKVALSNNSGVVFNVAAGKTLTLTGSGSLSAVAPLYAVQGAQGGDGAYSAKLATANYTGDLTFTGAIQQFASVDLETAGGLTIAKNESSTAFYQVGALTLSGSAVSLAGSFNSISGAISVTAKTGDVTATDCLINGGSVSLTADAGSILLKSAAEKSAVGSLNGDVTLTAPRGSIRVSGSSVNSGAIYTGANTATLTAGTGITVTDEAGYAVCGKLIASTAAGDIEITTGHHNVDAASPRETQLTATTGGITLRNAFASDPRALLSGGTIYAAKGVFAKVGYPEKTYRLRTDQMEKDSSGRYLWDTAGFMLCGADADSGLDLSSAPNKTTCYKAGGGYALWEPTLTNNVVSGGTLTLNNATIAGAGSGTQFTAVKLPAVPVTVKMQGTNAITASNATQNCGIGYGADTTIDLTAGSVTTITAGKAQNDFGISPYYGALSGATLTVQGSGALSVSAENAHNCYGIYAGENGRVQLLGGALSMPSENPGSNNSRGVYSGALTLGGVTVPAGVTLDLTEAGGVTQAEGTTAANNGVLVLPKGTQMTGLKLAGTGMVKIDTGNQSTDEKEIYNIYTNSGVQQTVITGTTTLNASQSTTADGYACTVDAEKHTAALEIRNNTVFDGDLVLPNIDAITISTEGTTTITGSLNTAQRGNATNLTISGGSLTVSGGINDATGGATVTVKDGAKVVSGPVSVGGSNAGGLKVTGSGTSLTAAGDNYGGAALSAGSVTLSGGAAVDAASTTGPAVQATNGSVSVTGGAKLTTHCKYGVYVKNGFFTVDRDSTFTDTGATTAAVCVVNTERNCLSLANLPAGNEIVSVTGAKGTYWSVVSTGSTLSVTDESGDPVTLTNAVKSLTLKDSTTSSDIHSGGTTAYTLTASAGENGAISPSGAVNVTAGDSKTFAITPAQGFAVADVLVDGKSVGAVTTYTFEKVFASHTISASFVKTSGYSDVKPDDWFRDDVAYVTEHHLMNGTGNGNFSPNASMTRGMIVTVLWRLAGSPAMEDYGYPYGDVNARTSAYAPAIYWARAQKIANGYTDDKFGPNDPITREQLAAMLYRYAGLKKYDVTGTADLTAYADVSALSRYAGPAVSWAVGAKLMQGSGARLMPKALATRAQVAAVFTRFCKNIAK